MMTTAISYNFNNINQIRDLLNLVFNEDRKEIPKYYYEEIPDDQFVPLVNGIDKVFLGRYEINKRGEIRNKILGKVYKDKVGNKGFYPRISFRNKDIKKTYNIHILVAKTFIPNPDHKPFVDHIDRNKENYYFTNLRWVTDSENAKNIDPNPRTRYAFARLDDNDKEIERLVFCEIPDKEFKEIAKSIRDGVKYDGNFWKKIDTVLENYCITYGYPKEEDWIESTRFPGFYFNKAGVVKLKSGIITIGVAHRFGYRTFTIDSKTYLLHRLIYEAFNNVILTKEQQIDHINTDPLDNRLENLRLVSKSENMSNPLTKAKLSRPIKKFSFLGEELKQYDSVKDALEDIKGYERGSSYSYQDGITKCCDGKSLTAFGYLWCDVTNEEKIQKDMKRLIYQYDKFGKLVAGYRNYASVYSFSLHWRRAITKAIKTGSLCSDGYYYSRGPRDFTNKDGGS